MKSFNKLLPGLLILSLLAACNLPGLAPKPPLSPQELASTIVAGTMQAKAISTSPGFASTPFASPAPATPTTKPTLFINTNNAKCRGGPGANFKVIATYPNGTTVDLIAKDTTDGWWIIKDPSSADLCWVQVQDATPGGSFDTLPEVTPQKSTAGVPAKPGSITYGFNCDNTSLNVTMSWTAASDNVNGYHVYRQGTQIADLPAGTTSYADKIDYTLSTPITYSVDAYNDSGVSPQRSITFHCP